MSFARERIKKASNTVFDEHGWEQGALNADGSLKDASEIDFGNDPGAARDPGPSTSGSTSRLQRSKNKRMLDTLIAEKEDSDSNEPGGGQKRKPKRGATTSAKGKGKRVEGAVSDPDDPEYSGDTSEESDSDSEADVKMTNEEIADGLPMKTVPEGTSRRPKDPQGKKKPRKKTENRTCTGWGNLERHGGVEWECRPDPGLSCLGTSAIKAIN
ncbi:hypothetical protein FB451DRAFT_1404384 [Mycena latifolia]|nr:hypothetical protein FB451DRAFT_1404384 [Mycena latifolia]